MYDDLDGQAALPPTRAGAESDSQIAAYERRMADIDGLGDEETDVSLVELARAGTAWHIERIVRACRRYGPQEEREKTKRMHDSRYAQISHDEDGMFILRARLDPIAGEMVARALDAAGEALYQRTKAQARAQADRLQGCHDTPAVEMAPGQRRADALVLLAESALAGGLDPGTAGDRYQVVVHVDAPVLADSTEQGVSALASGQHVSAEACRRVACDAAAVEGFELKRLAAGDVEFRRPDGRLLPEAPTPPREPIDPFEALLKRLEDGAIAVDPYTGTPSWDGSPPDLALAVETHLARAGRERSRREPASAPPDAAQQGALVDADAAPRGAVELEVPPLASPRDPWRAMERAVADTLEDDRFEDDEEGEGEERPHPP